MLWINTNMVIIFGMEPDNYPLQYKILPFMRQDLYF